MKKEVILEEILTKIKVLASKPFSNPQKQRLEIVKIIDKYRE